MTLNDMVGLRFGRLTVLSVHRVGYRRKCMCICECGNEKEIAADNVLNAHTTSCGCFRVEVTRARSIRHGQSNKTPEYQAWAQMRRRCNSRARLHNSHRYSGRGIKVCDRWLEFESFFEDMGCRPSPRHSIERRDNDGDYTPDNCYWATKAQQARNRSSNIKVNIGSGTKTLTEACLELSLNYDTVRQRIVDYGFTHEEALELVPSRRIRKSALLS